MRGFYYDNYFQPDQGYYTNQPATVSQLNHVWSYIKKLRAELSNTINEFNSFNYDFDNLKKEASEVIKEETDKIKNSVDELKKDIEKTTQDFEQLEEYITAQIKELDDKTLKNMSLTVEPSKIKITKKFKEKNEYDNIILETTNTETATTATIEHTTEGEKIKLETPGLADSVISKKIKINAQDKNNIEIKYNNENIKKIKALQGLEFIDDGQIIQIQDKDKEELKETIKDLNNNAITDLHFYHMQGIGGVILCVDGLNSTGEKIASQNFQVASVGGFFVSGEILQYVEGDEFEEKYKAIKTNKIKVNGLELDYSEQEYKYNADIKKVEKIDNLNAKKIALDDSDSDRPVYFGRDGDIIYINSDQLTQKIETLETQANNINNRIEIENNKINKDIEKIEYYQDRQIVKTQLKATPLQSDKIEIYTQLYYKNGEHSRGDSIILNFRNNDQSLKISTTKNNTVENQIDIQINLSKKFMKLLNLDDNPIFEG